MWLKTVPYLVPIIAILAALTTTFGNLAAYGQTNLKRLLAYSTIAHAGFMMMALATVTREGAAAMLFYLIVYLHHEPGGLRRGGRAAEPDRTRKTWPIFAA